MGKHVSPQLPTEETISHSKQPPPRNTNPHLNFRLNPIYIPISPPIGSTIRLIPHTDMMSQWQSSISTSIPTPHRRLPLIARKRVEGRGPRRSWASHTTGRAGRAWNFIHLPWLGDSHGFGVRGFGSTGGTSLRSRWKEGDYGEDEVG